MPLPATVLTEILASDPTRPRLTFYDDEAGERIELSAKVLVNWVNKAANALQDEFDVQPGSTVRLDLPPLHWRTFYWALAVWAVGGTVDVTDRPPGHDDVLVTDDPGRAAQSQDGATGSGRAAGTVLVTLAALARSHPRPVPAGVFDDARELATHGDQFTAWQEPSVDDTALVSADGALSYSQVVPDRDWPTGSRVHVTGDLTGSLREALAAWASGGSIVLLRRADLQTAPRRLASEGITIDLAG